MGEFYGSLMQALKYIFFLFKIETMDKSRQTNLDWPEDHQIGQMQRLNINNLNLKCLSEANLHNTSLLKQLFCNGNRKLRNNCVLPDSLALSAGFFCDPGADKAWFLLHHKRKYWHNCTVMRTSVARNLHLRSNYSKIHFQLITLSRIAQLPLER